MSKAVFANLVIPVTQFVVLLKFMVQWGVCWGGGG
jgi:hypothetical protein